MLKPLYIWAGGKTKMLPKYVNNPGIPLSGYKTYVEPFFGGGAMMCWINEHNPDITRYVINDVKPELIGIYKAIKSDCSAFIQRVDHLESAYLSLEGKENRKAFYYDIREEYTVGYEGWDPTFESATLYFMMKTCFNGIWQTTKKSKGRMATPFGLGTQKLTIYDRSLVKVWNLFLQQCDIHCGDWKTCANAYLDNESFFFMDPPYRGSFTSYGEEFPDENQIELLDFCQTADEKGNLVFLCNRDTGDDFWESQVGDLAIEYYDVTYTAGRRKKLSDGTHEAKKAQEVLLYSAEMDNK